MVVFKALGRAAVVHVSDKCGLAAVLLGVALSPDPLYPEKGANWQLLRGLEEGVWLHRSLSLFYNNHISSKSWARWVARHCVTVLLGYWGAWLREFLST